MSALSVGPGLLTTTPPASSIQPVSCRLHTDGGRVVQPTVQAVLACTATVSAGTDDIVLNVTNKWAAQQAFADRGKKLRHAGRWVSNPLLKRGDACLRMGQLGGRHGA
jgi:hypothetical protein